MSNHKYRVFAEQLLHINDDGSRVYGMRAHDMRDRTKDSAIRLAATLPLGNVRPKGSNRVVWTRPVDEWA